MRFLSGGGNSDGEWIWGFIIPTLMGPPDSTHY